MLENPAIRRQARPIDLQTYHWMQRQGLVAKRAELIRGVIVEKMSKSPLHEGIVRRLFRLLQSAARPGLSVQKQSPLTLENSEPEPDLSVVPERADDFIAAHPSTALFVVEVAVTSLDLDREKIGLYARAGVPEYWIVRATEGIVEVHRDLQAGAYASVSEHKVGETLQGLALPELAVDLEALFRA